MKATEDECPFFRQFLSRRDVVQIFLKSAESIPDLFSFAQIGHGVRNRVVVLKSEQRHKLFLAQFVHAYLNVL